MAQLAFLPAAVGFLFGAGFVYLADKFFPADSLNLTDDKKDDTAAAASSARRPSPTSVKDGNSQKQKGLRQRMQSRSS